MFRKTLLLFALFCNWALPTAENKCFPIEDSCALCLSPKKMSFCLNLFKQAIAGTPEEFAFSIFISQDQKEQLCKEAALKAARKTKDHQESLALADIIYKNKVENCLKMKIDRIQTYYQNLIQDSQERESDALKKGFYIPEHHLSETVCNDARLILGENGSALNSISTILFDKISPTKTTFGYVSALDAIVSPSDDIKALTLFQNKLKMLASDQSLLDQISTLLSRFAKLEHAYFYLYKMPKPEPYEAKKYESFVHWRAKVESNTFDLSQWGDVGFLDKWGSKGLTFSAWLSISMGIFLPTGIIGGAFGYYIWMGWRDGWKKSATDIFMTFYNAFRGLLNLDGLAGKDRLVKLKVLWDLAKFLGFLASPATTFIKNPKYITCQKNNLFTILWARNFCVDIRNFLKLAMDIEQKAFYVGIGDGRSISDSILFAKDPELAKCLHCLMESSIFESKCSLNDPKNLLFNFGKVIYILVYLTNKNRNFMTEIARRIGEIDYTVATVNLVVSTKDQDNRFEFVEFIESDNAVVDCKGTWNLFVDSTKAVANDIGFGLNKRNNVFVNGYILTGGNGVGKSCFSSSWVTSTILGQTLTVAPVKRMRFTPYSEILTYVKVDADPTKGQSLFMAQMNNVGKMAALAEIAGRENKKVLLFMDESLSGTRWTIGTAITQALITKCFTGKKNISMILATHLDLIARTCEQRSGGSILPIRIACQTSPEGRFLRSLYKLAPGVCISDTAFSIAENQWSEYGFCKDVVEAAEKEYKALESIEEYGKRLAQKIPAF